MNSKKIIAMALVSMSLLGNTAFADESYDNTVISQQAALTKIDKDQNKQLSKEAFTKEKVDTNTFSGYFIQEQLSKYEVFAGTVIPGILITGVNSDLPGEIIGQVSQNVYDTTTGQYLLIPQGTKIIGKYDSKTTYGQNRALIVWNRLIFPNGKSIILGNMQGYDRAGYSGFHDKVHSHYARVIWSAILGGAITGGVAAVTSKGSDDDSFGAQAGEQAAENISSATNNIVNKNLNVQPTVIIRSGYQFNIIVDKDLILEPYNDPTL